jgi:hypothetical protein
MYKKYIKPFLHGTAEQWQKFMEDLNIVIIWGNGLNNNSPACFNLTWSSLNGEALCIFNDKAAEQKEEMRDTHFQCLCAITEHVFPKDNLLLKQKTYMCNHVFLHLGTKWQDDQWVLCQVGWTQQLSWWIPPFQPNQCFTDEQTKDILPI